MTRIAAVLLVLFALIGTNHPLYAQTDTKPPYLYYYSRLLGGLIIERSDGTDSRQIASHVIPPNMQGLAGPGWSPSGKYFAAYSLTEAEYFGHTDAPYLIDTKGLPVVAELMNTVKNTSFMQWSPTGEDILLIIGSFSVQPERTHDYFVWIIDATHNKILSEFGMRTGDLFYTMSEANWDIAHRQIIFYMREEPRKEFPIYRIIMHFDGTTQREISTTYGGLRALVNTYKEINADNRSQGRDTSPNGTYTSYGNHPPKLTDTRTGEMVELPVHTGSTFCRDYIWSVDEAYMITLDGTLIAGGGCASAMLGITNPQGTFWRELGGCTWSYPPCVGWLPSTVDLDTLPPGSPKPVQLDPINIEYARHIEYIDPQDSSTLRLTCGEDSKGKSVGYLRQPKIDTILYTLRGMSCEKLLHVNPFKDGSISIATAEDPVHHLLATYLLDDVGVRLWIEKNGLYEPLLKLNSQGFKLEFTDHNERLRARNYNGWKIYSVADILAYAGATKPHE